jgi:hypothetical protein
MRRVVLALAVVTTIASCKLHGLASVVSFEGEIEMSTGIGTATMKIKGAKMRSEATGLGVVSIVDSDAKKSWSLDPATRTYREMDLAALSKSSRAAPSSSTLVKTRRSDTVAGRSCDIYEIRDGGAVVADVCAASGIGMMAMGLGGPFSAFAAGDDAWSEAYSRGFPLRIVLRDPKGAPLMKIEATRIERKSVPDADFQIPAGYTKL